MTPVRLKVAYKTPESLLGELTKSVGRGGVRIETKKSLPVGTKFVFELKSPGVKESVEVSGTVLTVTETAPGKYVLHIKYEPPKGRQGLDAVIKRIFETAAFDKKRKTPRIPLHVRATEDRPDAPTYRLRDISSAGVGIDVESDALPRHIKVGGGFSISMRLTTGVLNVTGQVVWLVSTRESATVPPRVGVSFGRLDPAVAQMLDDLLTLKALPTPPWIARLTFG
ncbi:MAG: PilZ domain-containing protein [Archangium sp.]|nr:PilZ domain-containing protein [Archangium sp.]